MCVSESGGVWWKVAGYSSGRVRTLPFKSLASPSKGREEKSGCTAYDGEVVGWWWT